ncbi:hypothetical protein B5K03_27075 [Rhizobium phaseoli]|nr:hypothetical protein B5K03_27075 [Rhizobium phaseoli]
MGLHTHAWLWDSVTLRAGMHVQDPELANSRDQLQRTFQDIPLESIAQASDRSFLRGLGWSRGSAWEHLLLS